MIHLNILVEGPTEQRFIRRVLGPFLVDYFIYAYPRGLQTSRDKRRGKVFKGGGRTYAHYKRDLNNWLKEDIRQEAYFTSMIDLYALPSDFPGYAGAVQPDPYDRVDHLEQQFKNDINHRKFIPYISLYEFETLIFTDPVQLIHQFPNRQTEISRLNASVSGMDPEEINDSPQTAPSKRIISHIPEYKAQKATAGPIVAEQIGMQKMLDSCPHFKKWADTILSLSR